LSGDINPLHVDPLAARRSAGKEVGAWHARLAWSLERSQNQRIGRPACGLDIRFLKPLYLDEELKLPFPAGRHKNSIFGWPSEQAGRIVAASLRFGADERRCGREVHSSSRRHYHRETRSKRHSAIGQWLCREPGIPAGLSECGQPDRCSRCCEGGCLFRLVGMECPGRIRSSQTDD